LSVRAHDIGTRSRVNGEGGVVSHKAHNGMLTYSEIRVKSSDNM
jgi:hypothetical protein